MEEKEFCSNFDRQLSVDKDNTMGRKWTGEERRKGG